ncbi:BLUF domain-containing protein [Microbacterium hatanonis]|uniref:BLUF domain-containing protein n=1 Tax=Microbacterium hatanonis TaxID=404366 RepID=A0A5C8HW95_9MICO|nr:BLUF domain-containing protein [Microbacterium hatanonis]TXK10349.1 BLUF domain-containing protein [Microbacterium hatanonis]
MTTELLSILYSSRAAEPFDDDRLRALLAQSRENNARHDLTGMLLYRGGRFVQVLEGPESTVRELVATIGADPRHTNMRVLFEEHLEERQFAEWTMGYEPISEPREEKPAAFRDTFDDLEVGDDATATLRAVRELSLWFRVRSSRGQ